MIVTDIIIERSGDIKADRARALIGARSAFRQEFFGTECKVHGDDLVYVVCRDGVHRLTKSPDGRTTSDRRI